MLRRKRQAGKEEKHRDQEEPIEQPRGMQGVDLETWKNELLDEMEKRFRMILRGPVWR